MKLENGIHDIPNEAYHSSEGISRSALWEFKKSPWHYWNKYLNPERIKQTCTPAMKMGELVHALVLEPNCFEERYLVQPTLVTPPKLGLLKELGRDEYDSLKTQREAILCANELTMDEFRKHAEGKEIIAYEVYNEAKTYADAVLGDAVAHALFTGVNVERSIYFTHKKSGLQCKVRPDAWVGSVVTDLKTCNDASFSAFQSAAYRSGYFLQAAMIKEALASIDIEMEKFIFYCIEKSPGCPCVYYEVDNECLIRATLEFDALMHGLADCLESQQWDCYEPQTLTYPSWVKY